MILVISIGCSVVSLVELVKKKSIQAPHTGHWWVVSGDSEDRDLEKEYDIINQQSSRLMTERAVTRRDADVTGSHSNVIQTDWKCPPKNV